MCGADLAAWQAIDSFGSKYLLGIFEKEEDAKKAFDVWNKEYEQARLAAIPVPDSSLFVSCLLYTSPSPRDA